MGRPLKKVEAVFPLDIKERPGRGDLRFPGQDAQVSPYPVDNPVEKNY